MRTSLEQLLADHCVPALVGIEPANLITVRRDCPQALERELEAYRRAFAPKGVAFYRLCGCAQRELIMVGRPRQMEEYLARPQVSQALMSFGYRPEEGLEGHLARLKRHIQTQQGFPHEIGLFLGYPVEDVLEFIRQKGRNCKLSGPWKVYGDVEQARKIFCRISQATGAVRKRMEEGRSLLQVFAVA